MKTPVTENDLWGSTDISVESSRTSLRNNRLDSSKTNTKIESDNGWGDWNDGGSEGKLQYHLQKTTMTINADISSFAFCTRQ